MEERKLAHLRRLIEPFSYPRIERKNLACLKLPERWLLDISTIQGTDTVASAVFFENGKPKKKFYRHFIIKSLDTQNDYAALQETLTRYLKECDENPEMLPDLFIIDGGKGQLNACLEVLKNSKYPDIPIISLAKRIEEVFTPANSNQ